MFPQYDELWPTNGWDRSGSLGHPCKFQLVSCLGSVTAWHSSIGRQPNFAALNRGRHLYSAGRPSRGASAHILIVCIVWRCIVWHCDSAVYAISLCPSVSLSVTCWCSTKMAKHGVMQTMPYDSPGILVFWHQTCWWNLTGSSPLGAPNIELVR